MIVEPNSVIIIIIIIFIIIIINMRATDND